MDFAYGFCVLLQMVRNYKAKGKRCQWNRNSLQQAIADVESKTFTIRAASRAYGIPRASLQDAIKAKQRNPDYVAQRIGRKPTLGVEFERELHDHAITMSGLYYGITKAEVCRLAYELATRNKIKHTFNNDKKVAGSDWFNGFLRRHPDLSMRIPESTSMSRIIGFRRSEINRFFDNLTKVMASGVDPGRIFNVDETGLSTVQKQKEPILSPKGHKQVGRATSAEKGVTITAVCCISATGVFIPPMLIFPRKNFAQRLLRGAPPGTIGGCSPSGWINSDLFVTWLKHFIKSSGASVDKKTILLLDNHESHISIQAFELCRSNGISLVSFAPHTSHRCQPLDLTVYGPLKTAYYKRCSEWMKSNVGKRITDEFVAELFADAYGKIATVDKCVCGFRAGGIWPLNSAVLNDEDFAAADHLVHGQSTVSDTQQSNMTSPVAAEENNVVVSSSETIVESTSTAITTTSLLSAVDTTSTTEVTSGEAAAEIDVQSAGSLTENEVIPVQTEVPLTPVAVPSCSHHRISLTDISPVPQPLQKEGKRKSTQRRSEILTASPMKEMLQQKKEKQDKKKEKEMKQIEKIKQLKKIEREESRKAKRKLDVSTHGPSRKTSKPSAKNKKSVMKLTDSSDVWICATCAVHYGDKADPKHTEDWVSCSGCSKKFHVSCGENCGVFDDDDSFICKDCIC